MFTNEIEFEETITTLMDDAGQYEDVQIFIDDNEVFIRQWSELNQGYDLIVMSHKMFQEFTIALNTSEGLYITKD